MIELGAHWEFIAAAYGGVALVVGAMTGWTIRQARLARARVDALEKARGER